MLLSKKSTPKSNKNQKQNPSHHQADFYQRDERLYGLLPLQFDDDDNLKNLVLIVRPEENHEYTGVTVMDIGELYHKVRAVENPDCSWIRREVLDNYKYPDTMPEE